MQYKITKAFKKVIAVLLSFLASLGITFGQGADGSNITRPDANTVAQYSSENADYTLNIDAANKVHEISDLLYGVFFEDINFAADGGLYAELVINRSFEYGELATDDELHGWSKVGAAEYEVKKNAEDGLNENNKNYLVITNNTAEKAGVANRGFLDGIAVSEGTYYASLYAKALGDYQGAVTVRIVAGDKVLAEGRVDALTENWAKYELELEVTETATSGVYYQVLVDEGSAAFDMVSLFPETYKGHGMRKDLAVLLEELEPTFLRFPGGCVIEGETAESSYNWKDSIGVGEDGLPLEFNGKYGDVAARSYGENIWTAHAATDDPWPCYMSYGLGFYEYFQLAEDIGAVGVPVLNCGLFCQMRGKGPVEMYEEDGVTYTAEFKQYLEDMTDLVEFCRGGADTTWGKVRVSLGHEEPFALKYICIGNENEGSDYFERYTAFLEYFNEAKAADPELYEGLELIYSSGADDATSGVNHLPSYEYAKDYIEENNISIDDFAGATDHHYYNSPEWFLENADYYDEDNYKRSSAEMTDTLYGGAIKVFLGEYASWSNTLKSALAEGAYMTGLERNGDIVEMAAYAPLFGNLTAYHWAPNLIWFNNHQSTGSINYYMQKLFSTNAGTSLIKSDLSGAVIEPDDLKGMVGLGTWWTSAEFDNVKVVSNETGRTLAKDCFTIPNFWWNWYDVTENGDWKIKNGKLSQNATEVPYHELGTTAYFGNSDWSNYTFTVEATKTGGAEGFYIPFLIEDENNCFYWNIGGWNNTYSALQRIEDGVKSGEIPGTKSDFTVEEGVTYEIKIVVDGVNIKGYIDGELQFDYDAESDCNAQAYHVVSTDETGDIIIKLVNVTDSDRTFAIDLANIGAVDGTMTVDQVAGDSLGNDNILGAEEDCIMKEFTVKGVASKFNYTVPQFSATVIRIHPAG